MHPHVGSGPRRFALMFCALVLTTGLGERATAQAAPALTPTDAPTLMVTRDLRIDGNAQSLVEVRWLLIARDGAIAVSQEPDAAIRFFSPTGASLGRFGRKGQGPGEFGYPSRAGWVGDTLWVYDDSLRRATFVAPNRTVLRTANRPLVHAASRDAAQYPEKLTYVFPRAIRADGSWLVIAAAAPRSMALGSSSWVVDGMLRDVLITMRVLDAPVPPGYDIASPEILSLAPDGEIARRIGRLPADPSFLPIRSPVMGGAASLPFVGPPLEAVAPDGGWVVLAHETSETASGGTFAVVAVRAAGDTMFARTYPFTAAPIPQRVLDSVSRRTANAPIRTPQDAAVNAALKAVVPPKNYPPLAQLIPGRDGTLWIGLRPTATTRPYLVLDQRGLPIGRLSLPLNTRILAAETGMIWGVETDSDDVPSIVRYRVTRP